MSEPARDVRADADASSAAGTSTTDRPPRARRGVAEIAVGTAAGQGILVAVSPVLSRLYHPDDFALLQIFTGVVSVGAVLASLRLELALPLATDHHQARALLRAGLVSTVSVAVLLFVLGAVSTPLWARGATLTGLAAHWWLVPLTVAVIATFQLVSAVLVRMERYRGLAVRSGAQGVGTAAAQVAFGAAGVRPLGLLLGMALGRLAGLAGVLRRRTRGAGGGIWLPATERVQRADVTAAVRRFRRFPLVSTWSALANNAGQYAPYLVFSLTYGATPTGWLAFTARLLALPVTVLGQAVAQVYLGRGAAATRGSTGELPRLTWFAVRRLTLVGVLPAAALAIVGPWAFGFVYGEVWEQSGLYARLLAVAFLAQFVASPVTHVFNLLERQEVAMVIDGVRLVGVVVAPLVAWWAGASDVVAVGAYAAVLTASYGAVLLAARVVLRRG